MLAILKANMLFISTAAIAQLVEQRIRNAWVGCSSHPSGTINQNLRQEVLVYVRTGRFEHGSAQSEEQPLNAAERPLRCRTC